MKPSEDQQLAFERLAKQRDMIEIVSYYESLVANICDVRNIKTDEIDFTKKAAQFLQTEFIDRLKKYNKPLVEQNTEDSSYL